MEHYGRMLQPGTAFSIDFHWVACRRRIKIDPGLSPLIYSFSWISFNGQGAFLWAFHNLSRFSTDAHAQVNGPFL